MATKIIMTADELVRLHKYAASLPTTYMYACYGWPVTEANIVRKAAQNLNGWYTKAHIEGLRAVANRLPPVWGFDCVNLTKGILWGWRGDASRTYGGATYGANGVPDTNANGFIARCKEVSTDFSHIEPGEGLWLEGHWGLYIGDGLAVECTGRWANGVQITAVWNLGRKVGYNGRYWTKHGKLPWVQYAGQPDAVEPEVIELGSRLIKRGTQGSDVIELQKALMALGYELPKFGTDGDCGSETVTAVLRFQEDHGIEADGKVGPETLGLIRAELAKGDQQTAPANPMELTYTITIKHVPEAEKAAMLARWPDAKVVQE